MGFIGIESNLIEILKVDEDAASTELECIGPAVAAILSKKCQIVLVAELDLFQMSVEIRPESGLALTVVATSCSEATVTTI